MADGIESLENEEDRRDVKDSSGIYGCPAATCCRITIPFFQECFFYIQTGKLGYSFARRITCSLRSFER